MYRVKINIETVREGHRFHELEVSTSVDLDSERVVDLKTTTPVNSEKQIENFELMLSSQVAIAVENLRNHLKIKKHE